MLYKNCNNPEDLFPLNTLFEYLGIKILFFLNK